MHEVRQATTTYPFVLLALGLQFFLFNGSLLKISDRLFKSHHVGVSAFVSAFSRLKLHLQLFVFFFLDTNVLH